MKSISEIVDPRITNKLSKPSFLKAWFNIILDYATIIILATVTHLYLHPIFYIPVVMLIANRQHGLLILMHDSSHKRLFRNRKLNEIVGELLLAWPLFIKMIGYRIRHDAHHAYANSTMDPDFIKERYITNRKELYTKLLMDVTALNTKDIFKEIKKLQVKCTSQYKMMQLLFYISLATTLTIFGLWKVYLLYWIVPCFTWLKVLLRLRALADHTGVQNREKPFDTRTIIPNIFDRLFIAPHHCSYHLVHHTIAAIPCYNLKAFHKELEKNTEFIKKAHINHGFYQFLQEIPFTNNEIKEFEIKTNLNFSENMPVI